MPQISAYGAISGGGIIAKEVHLSLTDSFNTNYIPTGTLYKVAEFFQDLNCVFEYDKNLRQLTFYPSGGLNRSTLYLSRGTPVENTTGYLAARVAKVLDQNNADIDSVGSAMLYTYHNDNTTTNYTKTVLNIPTNVTAIKVKMKANFNAYNDRCNPSSKTQEYETAIVTLFDSLV